MRTRRGTEAPFENMSEYDVVKAAVYTPTRNGWGIPVKVEGGVGIGKTAMLSEIAEAEGFHLEVMTLSLMESVEAQGHPYIDTVKEADSTGKVTTRKQMTYAVPDTFRRAAMAERSIVYLDEINMTEQRTFAAFMRVVNERMAGGFHLGPNVRFVAACNPIEIAAAAGGIMIPRAMNNRFCHLKGKPPTLAKWGKWLIGGEGEEDLTFKTPPAEATEARVMKVWPATYRRAAAEVLAYLEARPNQHNVPPQSEEVEAFATPRTWDMFTRARASSKIFKLDSEDAFSFEAGCIGNAATAEFRTWVRNQDLPSAADFLAGQATFDIDARRLDRTQAFMISLAVEWSSMQQDARQPELERLAGFFSEFKHRRDVLVTPMTLLSSKNKPNARTELLVLPKDLKAVFASVGDLRDEV